MKESRSSIVPTPVNATWDKDEINSYVDGSSQQLFRYLDYLGIPTNGVLVEPKERAIAIFILPSIIERLDTSQKNRAYYISKFIASCAAGLFDAALNYLWDETILNLREKIIKYDLDYFFNAIKGIDRKKFSNADDLSELSDMQLIEGCKETEIITVIGFKHLNYIRDMRNFASAAHPNQNELTGLQVAGWLETCIREVLAKEPSEAAILVKKLLVHIREESFDPTSVKPINAKIQQLPRELSGSLLRSIFGMYVDPKVSPNVKRNIDLISKSVWNHADDNAKSDIGFRYGFYSVNGDLGKKELASNFLTTVDGLSYLTEDMKAIEIKERLENLLNAHSEYHNFFNEEPHARMLFNYVHETSEIPTSVAYEYVKTLTICRLGNSYGVARSAVPYYDEMIKMFQDPLIRDFLNLLDDQVIIDIFKDDSGLALDRQRFPRYKEIAKSLHEKTSNYITKRGIEIVLGSKREDIINKKVYGKIKLLLES